MFTLILLTYVYGGLSSSQGAKFATKSQCEQAVVEIKKAEKELRGEGYVLAICAKTTEE